MKFLIVFVALLGVISATKLTPMDYGVSALMNVVKAVKTEFETPAPNPEAIWDPIIDFFKGIATGFEKTFEGDLSLFKECISCPPRIWEVWMEFFDYIKTLSWKTFNLGDMFEHVMDFVMGTISEAMPCVIIYMMSKKFIDLIMDPTWETLQNVLLRTLASNAQLLFDDIIKIFSYVIQGDFFVSGEYLGQIVYVILVH